MNRRSLLTRTLRAFLGVEAAATAQPASLMKSCGVSNLRHWRIVFQSGLRLEFMADDHQYTTEDTYLRDGSVLRESFIRFDRGGELVSLVKLRDMASMEPRNLVKQTV